VKPELRSLYDSVESAEKEGIKSSKKMGSIVEGPELKAATISETVSRYEDLRALTDEHCLLSTPWVKGLDLKTKKWGKKPNVT
jgi:hypothetical protein